MNEKEKIITLIIAKIISDSWYKGYEKDFTSITKETNFILREQGFPSPIKPKQVGVYIKKFLGLETERRGHKNYTFPVLTPSLVEKVKKFPY
jgi:hypothetical protein